MLITSAIIDWKSYIIFCDTKVIFYLSKSSLDGIVDNVGIEAKQM